MPTFLSDPSPAFTFVLVLVAVIAIGVWFRYRDKVSRNRLIAILVAVGAVLMIGFVVESQRQIAVKRIKDIETAANKRDWPAVLALFSDSFQYSGKNKAAFQAIISDAAKQFNAEIHVKDFDRGTTEYIGSDQVRIGFIAQITAQQNGPFPYYVEATFKKEADGQYRIVAIELYNFAKRKQGPPRRSPVFRQSIRVPPQRRRSRRHVRRGVPDDRLRPGGDRGDGRVGIESPGEAATGYAASVIGCDCEAGIEQRS